MQEILPKKCPCDLFFGRAPSEEKKKGRRLFCEDARMHLFDWVKPFEMVSAPAFKVQWTFWNQIFSSRSPYLWCGVLQENVIHALSGERVTFSGICWWRSAATLWCEVKWNNRAFEELWKCSCCDGTLSHLSRMIKSTKNSFSRFLMCVTAAKQYFFSTSAFN